MVGPGGSGTLQNVVDISAANYHTCAVRSDGTAWCWGWDANGQLGNGAAAGDQPAPTQVVGPGGTGTLQNVVDISAGEAHACAVRSDGTAWCWGNDGNGQLGNGATTGVQPAPTQVAAFP